MEKAVAQLHDGKSDNRRSESLMKLVGETKIVEDEILESLRRFGKLLKVEKAETERANEVSELDYEDFIEMSDDVDFKSFSTKVALEKNEVSKEEVKQVSPVKKNDQTTDDNADDSDSNSDSDSEISEYDSDDSSGNEEHNHEEPTENWALNLASALSGSGEKIIMSSTPAESGNETKKKKKSKEQKLKDQADKWLEKLSRKGKFGPGIALKKMCLACVKNACCTTTRQFQPARSDVCHLEN